MKCKECESKKNKKMCSKCNEYKDLKEFYIASSTLLHSDGKLGICKQCLNNLVDFDDMNTIKQWLRLIDRPFLIEEYEGVISSRVEKPNANLFGEYMRRLAMKHNRQLTWNDSIHQSMKINEDNIEENDSVIENLPQLKKIWGNQSNDDYEYLDNFYREYANTYATETPVQINLYRNIAKIHLQAEKELANGQIKPYKDLMELSSKLHNDGNIKPIQSTGANDDKGLSTYGLWIKEIEKEEPAEYFADKKIYEDYDGLGKYFQNHVIRPLKNIFNISKDFEIKDDK